MSLDALIVEPDLKFRGNITQAARSSNLFNRVVTASSLREALERVSDREPFRVMFLSERLDSEKTKDIIKQAKALPNTEDCAFVLIVRGATQSLEVVASQVIEGIDGMLCEPFSVDSMSEIANLAQIVKAENDERRKRAGYELVTSGLADSLDELATSHFLKSPSVNALNELKRYSYMLGNPSESDLELYFEIIITTFTDRPVPQVRRLAAVSKRMKNRFKPK
jgi:DNA-binding NtrC family response regulator